ncbi:PREDICTED: ion channel CASTOR-like [Ipomoea nil]|uniref:ion channel CASTOR-like n=1 Tax=Ipomoea nil TaxID=35883 RepID=UPI0009009E09|nr:PREDICTED: ion channel CASTOR-like [Ipomoea nil]XP_019188697.1 PREDICTED: ion channel CASTOR-like [Ipomoea nil]
MEDMIMVLEAFLAPGSELWMFNEVSEKERDMKLTDGGLDVTRLENIALVNREGNAVIRRHLESLPREGNLALNAVYAIGTNGKKTSII